MEASREGREPFLDPKLSARAITIPAALKIKNGNSKYILKKAVRGVIPDELIDRPKQGFGVPVYEWLLDRLGGTPRRAVDGVCAPTDIFHPRGGPPPLYQRLGPPPWVVLNFPLCHKHFIQRQSVPI